MSFFDVIIMREEGKLTTSVYHKPTLGRIYTHFDSFLTSNYTIGIIHTLLLDVSVFVQIGLIFTKNWLS